MAYEEWGLSKIIKRQNKKIETTKLKQPQEKT